VILLEDVLGSRLRGIVGLTANEASEESSNDRLSHDDLVVNGSSFKVEQFDADGLRGEDAL
jgi:hypothetical protein